MQSQQPLSPNHLPETPLEAPLGLLELDPYESLPYGMQHGVQQPQLLSTISDDSAVSPFATTPIPLPDPQMPQVAWQPQSYAEQVYGACQPPPQCNHQHQMQMRSQSLPPYIMKQQQQYHVVQQQQRAPKRRHKSPRTPSLEKPSIGDVTMQTLKFENQLLKSCMRTMLDKLQKAEKQCHAMQQQLQYYAMQGSQPVMQ